MPSGRVIGVCFQSDADRGQLQPDDGGPPLAFVESATQAGAAGVAHVLATTDVGASVTYNYNGGGLATGVRFST